MNKKKIGQYLKTLRKEKNWSQEKLSDQFRIKNFDVSVKSISDWENGKTIPEIEKLMFLSEAYGISVDEILDGEKLQKKNYFEEYVFADKNWFRRFGEKDNIYRIHQEHKTKVTKRFKELLNKKINEEESKNEDSELRFLFENFYSLSNYADKYVLSDVKDDYLKLLEAIRNKKMEMGDVKGDSFLYEISKFICPTEESEIQLSEIIDEITSNRCLGERFDPLNWWEKDMLLMAFQQGNIGFDPSSCGAKYLKRYEENYGEEFNENARIRKAIKYMIEHGACLNYGFVNIISRKKLKRRIIDRVEKLYLMCGRPLECSYMENGKAFVTKAGNNRKNRFVANGYYRLKTIPFLQNMGIEEMYDFVWKYDPENISDDLLLALAKTLNIDTNRDLKYIRADFNVRSFYLKEWKEYRSKEKEIDKGVVELRSLEEKLRKGELYIFVEEEKYIGGKSFSEMMAYFRNQKAEMSFSELKKMRSKEKTKQLLDNLDSYSLQDIRNIYMKEKVVEEEVDE